MSKIIVSRHPGALKWLLKHHPELDGAPIYETVTPELVRDMTVIGNIPLSLASLAREVWAIEFTGFPPRGAEYGAEEMEAAGAHLRRYTAQDLGEVQDAPSEEHPGMFLGIEAGQEKSACAGRTRGTATIRVSEDGREVQIGDRRVVVKPDTLVLWHEGSAGSWHGIVDPDVLADPPPDGDYALTEEAMAYRKRLRKIDDDLSIVANSSSSGAGNYVALAVKVDRRIGIWWSGYKGRSGHTVLVVEPDGHGGIRTVFEGPLGDWRARQRPPMSL